MHANACTYAPTGARKQAQSAHANGLTGLCMPMHLHLNMHRPVHLAPSHHRTLVVLQVADVGFEILGVGLQHNSTLQDLSACRNMMRSTGARALGQALRVNTGLKRCVTFGQALG